MSSAARGSLADMANAVRLLSADAVQKANSGHPGMPMGMADVATVLFSEFLRFSPENPTWPNRDRFVLSAGHGSMLLYSLLYLTGYQDITLDEIKNFRQMGAKTAGHPEYGHAAGIETTTGPLGQGFANAVGFALAERLGHARFGSAVDHFTYVIVGDGCLMEGISQEAMSLAGHLQLHKLIVLFDDNGISIDGPTSLTTSENHQKRFEACGWDVQRIDGHDIQAIRQALARAKKSTTPSMIACKTTIAYGAPTKAGSAASHGAPLGNDEIAGLRANLNWSGAPFAVDKEILDAWRQCGQQHRLAYQQWCETLKQLDTATQQVFERLQAGELPEGWEDKLLAYKQQLTEKAPSWATRKSSGEILGQLTQWLPELIGGSADLTGSNLTRAATQTPICRSDFSGSYVYYGIREHAMAAMMNGMALYGGIIPYGGTFLVFSDYCRPAMRLSALMQQRVVYVMTHDSIGLGEDGPTHQPVEHLAALRAIPNMHVFRPADAVETLECWQLALQNKTTPSVLALTRQEVPLLPQDHRVLNENHCAKGAYIVSDCEDQLQVTLFASGSEVALAMQAKAVLKASNIDVRVVSVPCFSLFAQQEGAYQQMLLCNHSVKVAIEAAIQQGWERFIGPHGIFIGMKGFGASAPAGQLYQHFGIDVDNIVRQVTRAIEERHHDNKNCN